MKLKEIKTKEAVGYALCHDITQIIPNQFKGRRFEKGHIICEEDISILLDLGKTSIYVYETIEGYTHENDAAKAISKVLQGENISLTTVNEGKINLVADVDGLLKINREALKRFNQITDIICATKYNNTIVNKGNVVAGTRAIPLYIHNSHLEDLHEKKLREIVKVIPFQHKKIGIVSTGDEVYHGRIEDGFYDKICTQLETFPHEILGQSIVPDQIYEIEEAIKYWIDKGADIIICTGGMSVDPNDVTKDAIDNVSTQVVSYGMPILSGCMTMLAYSNNVVILGIPAGSLFSEKSSIDLLLPRVFANDLIDIESIIDYGEGGLL